MLDDTRQLLHGACEVVPVGSGVEAAHHVAAELNPVVRVLDLDDQHDRSWERRADLADQLTAGRRYEHHILVAVSPPNVDELDSFAESLRQVIPCFGR